jgi:hypothetical protein
MKRKLIPRSASPDEITLYCLVGEAICNIQHLEGALSCAITLKLNSEVTWQAANEFLNRQHKCTLGTAIQISARENIFPRALKAQLTDFLPHRNWLVHNVMFESKDDPSIQSIKGKFFDRIKEISETARTLQHEIELDMVEFCESKGQNMSKIRATINAQYSEVE